jgi:AraC-like DNA-binding protein
MPNGLIANPDSANASGPSEDVLSNVLRSIRLSGSLQFCFMPTGDWQTDPKTSMGAMARTTSNMIPFHIAVEGNCWVKMKDRELRLGEGDIVMFPFRTPHDLGAGSGGPLINPVSDLPAKPWREVPRLRYGNAPTRVRLLCGYLNCDALNFAPLRAALPEVLHVRTKGANDAAWLASAVGQLTLEADNPRPGGLSMLERLTEIMFIEILRHRILASAPEATGWLAALADPSLARCLALIHEEPKRNWSIQNLASQSGVSRSTLMERFETKLSTSPMRYVRDWRLCLASTELSTTSKAIAKVADDAGYGTEAAFNRAFSRTYGMPPAAWRQHARKLANAAA